MNALEKVIGVMTLSEHLLETGSSEFHETETWMLNVPSDKWQAKQSSIWVYCTCGPLPKFGWKIHVSSTLEDAHTILQIVSALAFEFGCAFKYLGGRDSFITLHFKNASRLQSGKFIALYPQGEALAARMLDSLYYSLAPYKGLDILTDRAYKGSTNVFYRWGAYQSTGRLNSSGAPEELVPDGSGQMVPDTRHPRFLLPEGIVDPFSKEPLPDYAYSPPTTVSLDQFTIDSVLRFTNAGGRYKGTCQLSGAEIVIKEARPDTGFVGTESAIQRLRREVENMESINSKSVGLAPSVVKKFTVQEHEFVAIEYLPGTRLSDWIARENPLYSCLHLSSEHVHEYLERASRILEGIWDGLTQLHGLGIAYGDLSLGNIIIDEFDTPRFIDFEACTSINDVTLGLRTPDFCLLHQNGEVLAKDRDIYAYNCIAVSLILRLPSLAEISDYALQAVTTDLAKVLNEVPKWWSQACNYLAATSQEYSSYKVPDFVPPRLDTRASRTRLREMISGAALDCYLPEAEVLFPTSTGAREGAFLGFGPGCSGLLGALKLNGNEIDREIITRYADSVERAIEKRLLPMNYDVGIVGMIEPCSALGLSDLSSRILEIMLRDWANLSDPSLGRGLTGVSLTFLRHGYVAVAEEVMERAIQIARDYKWEKNGLLYGRSGLVAGACQFDSVLRSSTQSGKVIVEIIREEFGQTVRHPRGHSLSLRGEADGSRLLPYLSDGTAGLLLALMFAHRNSCVDFILCYEDIVDLAADLGTPFMLEGSLMDGAAGLAVVLDISRREFCDIADRIPDPGWERVRKYLLPLRSGVGVLHPGSLKFDLSHSQGSIGILEALLWVDGMAELNISGLYIPRRVVAVP
jgi:serine/threonine protein kinase